jgi:hypothetical protein
MDAVLCSLLQYEATNHLKAMAMTRLYLRLPAPSTSPRRLAEAARPSSCTVKADANVFDLPLTMGAWNS